MFQDSGYKLRVFPLIATPHISHLTQPRLIFAHFQYEHIREKSVGRRRTGISSHYHLVG